MEVAAHKNQFHFHPYPLSSIFEKTALSQEMTRQIGRIMSKQKAPDTKGPCAAVGVLRETRGKWLFPEVMQVSI